MDSKQIYEEIAAIADALPEHWRDRFALLVHVLEHNKSDARTIAVRRWLYDTRTGR